MDESGSGQRADVGNLASLGRPNLVGHQGDNGDRVAIVSGPPLAMTVTSRTMSKTVLETRRRRTTPGL